MPKQASDMPERLYQLMPLKVQIMPLWQSMWRHY